MADMRKRMLRRLTRFVIDCVALYGAWVIGSEAFGSHDGGLITSVAVGLYAFHCFRDGVTFAREMARTGSASNGGANG